MAFRSTKEINDPAIRAKGLRAKTCRNRTKCRRDDGQTPGPSFTEIFGGIRPLRLRGCQPRKVPRCQLLMATYDLTMVSTPSNNGHCISCVRTPMHSSTRRLDINEDSYPSLYIYQNVFVIDVEGYDLELQVSRRISLRLALLRALLGRSEALGPVIVGDY